MLESGVDYRLPSFDDTKDDSASRRRVGGSPCVEEEDSSLRIACGAGAVFRGRPLLENRISLVVRLSKSMLIFESHSNF
jgi:hypothetical protein